MIMPRAEMRDRLIHLLKCFGKKTASQGA
jgi:hypothetical protein